MPIRRSHLAGLAIIAALAAQAAAPSLALAEPAGPPISVAAPPGQAQPARVLPAPRRPAEAAPPQARVEPASSASWGLQTVLSLALVVGLIIACAAVLRRAARGAGGLAGAVGVGGRAPSGILEVLGRYPIARGQTLILLRVERHVLLVAQTVGGRGATPTLATLARFDEADDVAAILLKARDQDSESLSRRFETTLKAFEDESDRKLSAVTPRGGPAQAGPGSRALRGRLERLRRTELTA